MINLTTTSLLLMCVYFFASCTTMGNNRRRVIIDTDVGIDDTIAVVMMVYDPTIDIEAIIVSEGNSLVSDAISHLKKVLTLVGYTQIPIYGGSSTKVTKNPPLSKSDNYFGIDGFANVSHLYSIAPDFPNYTESGIDMLVNLARKYSQDISILALAPMTNVALAMKQDPSFTDNLVEIVAMGGNYKGVGNVLAGAEYNFAYDPQAAYDVLVNSKCPVTLIPIETANENVITWTNIRQMLKCRKPFVSMLDKFVKFYLKQNSDDRSPPSSDRFQIVDGIAATAFLAPDLITDSYENRVSVELQGNQTIGQLLQYTCCGQLKDIKKNTTIVTHLDMKRAYRRLIRRIACN